MKRAMNAAKGLGVLVRAYELLKLTKSFLVEARGGDRNTVFDFRGDIENAAEAVLFEAFTMGALGGEGSTAGEALGLLDLMGPAYKKKHRERFEGWLDALGAALDEERQKRHKQRERRAGRAA